MKLADIRLSDEWQVPQKRTATLLHGLAEMIEEDLLNPFAVIQAINRLNGIIPAMSMTLMPVREAIETHGPELDPEYQEWQRGLNARFEMADQLAQSFGIEELL